MELAEEEEARFAAAGGALRLKNPHPPLLDFNAGAAPAAAEAAAAATFAAVTPPDAASEAAGGAGVYSVSFMSKFSFAVDRGLNHDKPIKRSFSYLHKAMFPPSSTDKSMSENFFTTSRKTIGDL